MLWHPISFEGTNICPISEFRTVIIFVIAVELAHNGSWMKHEFAFVRKLLSSFVSAGSHEDKMGPTNETISECKREENWNFTEYIPPEYFLFSLQDLRFSQPCRPSFQSLAIWHFPEGWSSIVGMRIRTRIVAYYSGFLRNVEFNVSL